MPRYRRFARPRQCNDCQLIMFAILGMLAVVAWLQHEHVTADVYLPLELLLPELAVKSPVQQSPLVVDDDDDVNTERGKALLRDDEALPHQPPRRRHKQHKQCLVAYHIPKTGGISLGEYMKQLCSALGWRFREWHSWYGKHGAKPPSRAEDYTSGWMHLGHLTPHFETITSTQDCYKMTLLREPVDRVTSAFYYHKHTKEETLDGCFQKQCRIWHEYTNDVTRRFAAQGTAWNSYDVPNYLADADSEMDETSLQLAKARLTDFDFVCFLDRLHECIEYMAKQMGLKIDIKRKFENKGKDRQEISKEMQAMVAKGNRWDVELYRWAREKWGHLY